MKKLGLTLATLMISSLVLVGCGEAQTTTETTQQNIETTEAETTENETAENETTETEEGVLESTETVDIVLGDQTPSYALYFTFAKEKGFFDEVFGDDNVNIIINDFASGPVLNESFAAGEVDFGVMGTLPIISGRNNGYEYHIIGKFNSSENTVPLVATTASGIETLQDLKGKKVATAVGGQYHYLALKYLEKAGLTADDVELINATTDIPVLLQNGDIDAATWGLISAYELEDQGGVKIISDEPGDVLTGFIVATDSFVSQYPEYTEKVIEAIRLTLASIDENSDEYSSFLAEKTGKNKEYIDKYLSVNKRDVYINDDDIASIQGVIDFLVDQDILQKDSIKPEDLIDPNYKK